MVISTRTGDDELGFASDKRGSIARRVSELWFTRVAQDGDDGVNVVFDVRYFDEIAEIVQPRPRRRLAKSDRQQLVQAGQQTRFKHGVQDDSRGQKRAQKVSGDSTVREL